MRFQSLIQSRDVQRWGLMVLAFTVSLLAGVSFLIYDSVWTPLIIGGAVAAVGISALWIQKPVWALYAALLVNTIPEGLIPSTAKSIFNRFALVAAIGVWLLSVITQRRRLVLTRATLLMMAFLVWSTLSLLWAPYSDLGIEKIIQYASRMSLFLILIVNEINSKQTVNGLMNILALVGLIIIVAGIIAFALQGFQPGTLLEIFSLNSNSVPEHLIIAMPGILWQVFRASKHQRKLRMLLSVGYVLIALVLTVLTGSRGGLISILMTLLTFWIWKPTRPWGKLGLFVLAILLLSAPLIFSAVIQRFAEAEGATLGGRTLIWQAAFKLIWNHPLVGVGIGNADRAIMPYLSRIVDTWDKTERSIHNPVLQIWAETGFIGLIFYLGVLGSAIRSFFQQYAQHRKAEENLGASYFALIFSVSVGILSTWVKGGGMELAPSYFFTLALMSIPFCLNTDSAVNVSEKEPG